MNHFWWAVILISFSVASCADNREGADLSQISTRDAEFYCQAKEEWGDICDAGGENLVLYDEDIPGWGLAYSGTTPWGKSWWLILLKPDNPCMYEVIRHEIGHVIGYKHGDDPWMDESIKC